MNEIRVDIKEMVKRLRQPNREVVDSFAIDDSIDFLQHINKSYSDELPFLVQNLKESEDEETLNFIVCVLNLLEDSMNEEIIEILSTKVDAILHKKSNNDTLEYIMMYFSKHGNPFESIIIPILLKATSSNISILCKYRIFKILWKWMGFMNAVCAIKKGGGLGAPSATNRHNISSVLATHL